MSEILWPNDLDVWWALCLFICWAFSHWSSLNRDRIALCSYCSTTRRQVAIVWGDVQSWSFVWRWWEPIPWTDALVGINTHGCHAMVTPDSWTEQWWHKALFLSDLAQGNSTDWTSGMLLQPYINACCVKIMPTEWQDAQGILLLVISQTYCASVI